MKKLFFVTFLGVSLILGGCGSSQPSQSTQGAHSSSTEEILGVEDSQASAEEAKEPDIVRGYLNQNAEGLEDYFSANDFAMPYDNIRCWAEDIGTLYCGTVLPEKAQLNCRIDDPIIGDQRNFIFVQEVTDFDDRQINLSCMHRSDRMISYNLKSGREYRLVIYINNVSGGGAVDSSVHGLEVLGRLPGVVYAGNANLLKVTVSGSDTVGIESRAIFDSDSYLSLEWSESAQIYNAYGELTDVQSLSRSGAAIFGDAEGYTLDAVIADALPAGETMIFTVNFTTE